MKKVGKRSSLWYVKQFFQFPWIRHSKLSGDWYFEVVLFHWCFNYQINKDQ